MDIEDAIFNILSTNSGLIALIADRLYPDQIDQNATFPNVQFGKLDSVGNRVGAGVASGLFESRFGFDCWDNSHAGASDVCSKIRSILDGYSGIILGVRISGIMFDNQTSLYDPEAELYNHHLDLLVLHS